LNRDDPVSQFVLYLVNFPN